MPGFDGTGPRGMGPMTGGGRGFCSPWGMGRWYGSTQVPPYAMVGQWPGVTGAMSYPPQMSREQELDFLQKQAQAMKEQLQQIEARVQQLGSKT